MEKLKIETSLSLLQKIGKTLISVLTVMPAVGIMISIGKILQLAGTNIELIFTLGNVFEAIGWAIINNLPLLFAAAIGGTWSKEKAGGVFSAISAETTRATAAEEALRSGTETPRRRQQQTRCIVCGFLLTSARTISHYLNK